MSDHYQKGLVVFKATKFVLWLVFRCPLKPLEGGAFSEMVGFQCVMLGLRICINPLSDLAYFWVGLKMLHPSSEHPVSATSSKGK